MAALLVALLLPILWDFYFWNMPTSEPSTLKGRGTTLQNIWRLLDTLIIA